MAFSRSATDWTIPRRRRLRVNAEKKPSTALIQEAEVGVKWNVQRGCRSSQGAVVVGDGVDQLACRNGALDGVEEADEFLMPVLRHAAAQHGAVLHIKCGEQGGDTVAFGVMRPGAAFAGLERQPRLCAVERLDLRLLVIDSTTVCIGGSM
jgi:hypothetical protein